MRSDSRGVRSPRKRNVGSVARREIKRNFWDRVTARRVQRIVGVGAKRTAVGVCRCDGRLERASWTRLSLFRRPLNLTIPRVQADKVDTRDVVYVLSLLSCRAVLARFQEARTRRRLLSRVRGERVRTVGSDGAIATSHSNEGESETVRSVVARARRAHGLSSGFRRLFFKMNARGRVGTKQMVPFKEIQISRSTGAPRESHSIRTDAPRGSHFISIFLTYARAGIDKVSARCPFSRLKDNLIGDSSVETRIPIFLSTTALSLHRTPDRIPRDISLRVI